jgi:hypothetical protein
LSKQVAKLLRSCPKVQKFFDDLAAGTTSEEELLEVTEQLLSLLSKAKLRLNSKKCSFGVAEVRILGCIIASKGRKIDPLQR